MLVGQADPFGYQTAGRCLLKGKRTPWPGMASVAPQCACPTRTPREKLDMCDKYHAVHHHKLPPFHSQLSNVSTTISLYLFLFVHVLSKMYLYCIKNRPVASNQSIQLYSSILGVLPCLCLLCSHSTPLCSLWPTNQPHLPTKLATKF